MFEKQLHNTRISVKSCEDKEVVMKPIVAPCFIITSGEKMRTGLLVKAGRRRMTEGVNNFQVVPAKSSGDRPLLSV